MVTNRELLVAALLAGCSPPSADVPAETLDLLSRFPDEVQHQLGVLRPSLEEQWGAQGRIGWEDVTHETADPRHLYVWSKALDACLRLDAGPERDRDLDMVLWEWAREGSTEQRTVRVFLNDELLGSLALDSAPEEFRLPAPSATWRRGRNILRLSVDRLTQHPTGSWLGVALAEVRYDETRTVECDPKTRRLVLRQDTRARYDLEPGPGTTILLRGRSTGAGVLDLVLSVTDPETGDPRRKLVHLSLPSSEEELRHVLAAEVAPEEGIVSLNLSWSSPEEAEFEFLELSAAHDLPRARPSVVFITVDTLAAKNLSLYGYPRPTSPSLQRLARDAVVFQRCTSNSTWTVPSVMSVLTGLYSNSHALEVAPDLQAPQLWEMWFLANNRWTLAESLRGAGYDTAAFVDSLWLTGRFGFAQGFETFDASAGDIDKADPAGGIRHVTSLARSWLEARDGTQPFFLFLHCFDVHGPYSADAAHHGRFREDALFADSRTLPAGGLPNVFGIVPEYVTTSEYPGEQPERVSAARLRAAYDEGVLMVDEELGLFFDWLRANGLYDSSLIVVTADHGEALDAGPYYFGHGVLDEEVMHVPLLVKLPGNERAGTSVARAVQSVDLFPTIQELAGIRPHLAGLHGRSLLPLLRGETLPSVTSLCESGIMEQCAVERDGWKLVVRWHGRDSGDELLPTSPRLRELWEEGSKRIAEAKLRPDQVLYWSMTGEFLARLDERGMTPEVLAEFRQQPSWAEYVAFLRRLLAEPRYRLYYIPNDPYQRSDLSYARPDKVEELLELAHEEQAKRSRARTLARPPTQAVRLSETDLAELGKLGYAEYDDSE